MAELAQVEVLAAAGPVATPGKVGGHRQQGLEEEGQVAIHPSAEAASDCWGSAAMALLLVAEAVAAATELSAAAVTMVEVAQAILAAAAQGWAAAAQSESFGAQAAPSQTTQEMCDVRKSL